MTIDLWTLGFQTVNVVILVWLLQRFFWKPVSGMIAGRRSATQRSQDDTQAKRAEVVTALADIERTRAGLGKERDGILAAAHADAETARATELAEAQKQAVSLRTAAAATAAEEKDASEKAWNGRASDLSVAIAGKLAGRLQGQSIHASFLGWLVEAIRALPDSEKQAAAADGAALEAISATPLDPAEQEHCRTRMAEAFGAQPRISFEVDPALIAGLELHGPHFVVGNSWRADLTRIRADLTHDDRR